MGRITTRDIARAENLPTLIASLVKKASYGDAGVKESAAESLRSLAIQDHGEQLFGAGAIGPLVKILASGSAKAQSSAAGAAQLCQAEVPLLLLPDLPQDGRCRAHLIERRCGGRTLHVHVHVRVRSTFM